MNLALIVIFINYCSFLVQFRSEIAVFVPIKSQSVVATGAYMYIGEMV